MMSFFSTGCWIAELPRLLLPYRFELVDFETEKLRLATGGEGLDGRDVALLLTGLRDEHPSVVAAILQQGGRSTKTWMETFPSTGFIAALGEVSAVTVLPQRASAS